MDLKDKWNSLTREQKALVVLGVIILGLVLYAYHPIVGSPDDNNTTQVQQSTQPTTVTTVPFTQSGSNNTTVSDNATGNGTNQITAEQAKNIATQSIPGYTAEDPTQGSINVDGATHFRLDSSPFKKQRRIKNFIHRCKYWKNSTTNITLLQKT